MSVLPLELTLLFATRDGIAYFEGNDGQKYFRPRDEQPIRPLVEGQDDHPMMYQLSAPHPLAAKGVKFQDLEEANLYVGVLSVYEDMLTISRIALKERDTDLGRRAQELIPRVKADIRTRFGRVLHYFPEINRALDLDLPLLEQEFFNDPAKTTYAWNPERNILKER